MAAGELAVFFLDPDSCCLERFYMKAERSAKRPGHLYAALFFNRMWKTVPDKTFHEWWEADDCACHISLASDDELPEYNLRTTQNLKEALQEWKSSHSRVKATLQYIDMKKLSEERIVLNIIADEESLLFPLLNRLREILLGYKNPPEHEYHVSVTEAGTLTFRKEEAPGGSPADQPAQPSPGDATSSDSVSFASEEPSERPLTTNRPWNPWRPSPTGATSSAAGSLATSSAAGATYIAAAGGQWKPPTAVPAPWEHRGSPSSQ